MTIDPLPGGNPPGWASGWGQDRYGVFAEFTIWGDDGPVTQRLRYVPKGDFLMGSPADEADRHDNEGPRHPVRLTKSFWLFDTACTQRLWRAVMASNPSRFSDHPDLPVDSVSWDDIQDFLRRINALCPDLALRLPTEAEWEYACRAGTETPFSFGAQITPALVNYDGTFPYSGGTKGEDRGRTVPVGTLPANPWGLHEMHGNVWEWCADWDGAYEAGAAVDPLGPQAGTLRVLRGGSCYGDARDARSASRLGSVAGFRDSNFGFRCARGQG